MKLSSLLLIFFLLTSHASARVTLTLAQAAQAKTLVAGWWPESPRFIDDVLKGEVVSWADARREAERQGLRSKVVGLHPRSCDRSLRKIGLYEQYPHYLSFITEASYDEKNQKARFVMEHALLPFPMVLAFQIPRIRRPGDYSFSFPDGLFKGLQGKIRVASAGNRCLYFMQTEWLGTPTGIPDTVMSAFAQTLSKLGLEHLIRVSSL